MESAGGSSVRGCTPLEAGSFVGTYVKEIALATLSGGSPPPPPTACPFLLPITTSALHAVARQIVHECVLSIGRNPSNLVPDAPCEVFARLAWASHACAHAKMAASLSCALHDAFWTSLAIDEQPRFDHAIITQVLCDSARVRCALIPRGAAAPGGELARRRAVSEEAAIFAAASLDLDAALVCLCPQSTPYIKRQGVLHQVQRVFSDELRRAPHSELARVAQPAAIAAPLWAVWAEALGRHQQHAPHERYAPPDVPAELTVDASGSVLASPSSSPSTRSALDSGSGATRHTHAGAGLRDAMATARAMLAVAEGGEGGGLPGTAAAAAAERGGGGGERGVPWGGGATDAAARPSARLLRRLGFDCALITAVAASAWLRGVILTPGPHPVSWDLGKPGSSWARNVSRGASVVSDVESARQALVAAGVAWKGATQPPAALLTTLASLRSDALSALSTLALWVRDAAVSHVAPAMGLTKNGKPGSSNGRPGSSSGGVVAVAPAGWGCCSVAPEGGSRPPPPRLHLKPHGKRVAPDFGADARALAATRHPYAALTLRRDEEGGALLLGTGGGGGGGGSVDPWLHLARHVLHVLNDGSLLLPSDPRALAPLLGLLPSKGILGVTNAFLAPLLRGLRGLGAEVADTLARIGVECTLAAILGALRGGGVVGLAYTGLPALRAGGAAPLAAAETERASSSPLSLLVASPTPTRAAIAAVGLTPHGAVQLTVDLAYLRLWLMLGAPTRTAAAAAGAPVLVAGPSLFSPTPGHHHGGQQHLMNPLTPAPAGHTRIVAMDTPLVGPLAPTNRRSSAADAVSVRPPTSSGNAAVPPTLTGPWPGSFAELTTTAGLLTLHAESTAAAATTNASQQRRYAAATALAAHALQHHAALASTTGALAHGISRLLPAASGLAAASSVLHSVTQAACDLALLPLVLEAASGGWGQQLGSHPVDPSAIASRLRVARTVIEGVVAPPPQLKRSSGTAPPSPKGGGSTDAAGGGGGVQAGSVWPSWLDASEAVGAAQAAVVAVAVAGGGASGSMSARSVPIAAAAADLAVVPAAVAAGGVLPVDGASLSRAAETGAASAIDDDQLLLLPRHSLRTHVDAGLAATWYEAMDNQGYGLTAAKAVLDSLDSTLSTQAGSGGKAV